MGRIQIAFMIFQIAALMFIVWSRYQITQRYEATYQSMIKQGYTLTPERLVEKYQLEGNGGRELLNDYLALDELKVPINNDDLPLINHGGYFVPDPRQKLGEPYQLAVTEIPAVERYTSNNAKFFEALEAMKTRYVPYANREWALGEGSNLNEVPFNRELALLLRNRFLLHLHEGNHEAIRSDFELMFFNLRMGRMSGLYGLLITSAFVNIHLESYFEYIVHPEADLDLVKYLRLEWEQLISEFDIAWYVDTQICVMKQGIDNANIDDLLGFDDWVWVATSLLHQHLGIEDVDRGDYFLYLKHLEAKSEGLTEADGRYLNHTLPMHMLAIIYKHALPYRGYIVEQLASATEITLERYDKMIARYRMLQTLAELRLDETVQPKTMDELELAIRQRLLIDPLSGRQLLLIREDNAFRIASDDTERWRRDREYQTSYLIPADLFLSD